MVEGYRLVAIVICGRKQYLEVNLPQVYAQENVDEIVLFSNSAYDEDNLLLEKFKNLPRTRFYRSNFIGRNLDQYSFDELYSKICIEEKTIYVKIDDDIVFISPKCLKTLAEFKIHHLNDYFLIYPMIINNPFCNLFLNMDIYSSFKTLEEKLKFMSITWKNPSFAFNVHNITCNIPSWELLKRSSIEIGPEYNGMPRYLRPSVNLIAGTRDDFQSFHEYWKDKISKEIDEQYMTKEFLLLNNKKNFMVGDAVASHYAFFIQRDALKPFEEKILNGYMEFAKKQYDNENLFKLIGK